MDGQVEVTSWEVAPGTCLVEATGPAPWSLEKCLGTSTWSFFVSPDGQTLMGIDPLPLGEDWRWGEAPVVTLFERGEVKKFTNAAGMVSNGGALKRFSKRFAWVAGNGGLPGLKPAYATASEVSLTTAEGRSFRIGFDGFGLPPPGVVVEPPVEARPAQPPPPERSWAGRGGGRAPAQGEPPRIDEPPSRAPDVFSRCTYPPRAGSRNFFMCVRASPSVATERCSGQMSMQFESRVVCSCSEDRSGECEAMLR
jgi:hypothetical protein